MESRAESTCLCACFLFPSLYLYSRLYEKQYKSRLNLKDSSRFPVPNEKNNFKAALNNSPRALSNASIRAGSMASFRTPAVAAGGGGDEDAGEGTALAFASAGLAEPTAAMGGEAAPAAVAARLAADFDEPSATAAGDEARPSVPSVEARLPPSETSTAGLSCRGFRREGSCGGQRGGGPATHRLLSTSATGVRNEEQSRSARN